MLEGGAGGTDAEADVADPDTGMDTKEVEALVTVQLVEKDITETVDSGKASLPMPKTDTED